MSKTEANKKIFNQITELYFSPVRDASTSFYKKKTLWIVKGIEGDRVELVEDESQNPLYISLDDFLKDFDESTIVLSSGEKGYGKAFRHNMRVKLEKPTLEEDSLSGNKISLSIGG